MSRFARPLAFIFLGASTLVAAQPAPPAPPVRPVPVSCQGLDEPPARSRPKARDWNRHYRAAFEAIEHGELELAREHACTALQIASVSEARDWRFAETLDELGLIHYSRGEMPEAEIAQGSAVAEMLLAKGPQAPEVALYLQRLVLVLNYQGPDDLPQVLQSRPYRIFEQGYLPLDAALASRLDWLIAEYLRLEDLEAARVLQAMVDEIEARPSGGAAVTNGCVSCR